MLPNRFPCPSIRAGLTFCLLLAAFAGASAAPPEDTFLRDFAETRGFMLGRPVNPRPTPDGSAVLFLRARSAREPSQELYEFDVASRQTRRLLAPEDALGGAAEHVSPEEKARRERQRISVGGFTAFSISKDSALVLLSLSGKLYVLTRADGKVRELATGPGTIVDPKFSPDSKLVAYVRNQDVCVFDLATGQERAVTTGGTETISHGLAEFVAQEEMGRFSGYWWSPDSRAIAYQESDASKVESWYPADPAQPGNPPQRVFYPRPGKENVAVRIGVVTLDNPAHTVWLDYDRAKYPYLGKVTWQPEGPLTLTLLSRDQRDLALLTADPETGRTTGLLAEHDDAWVNLGQDVPVWLSQENGGGFLWASDQVNGRQLERRDARGIPVTGSELEPGRVLHTLAGVAAGRACAVFFDPLAAIAGPEFIPLDRPPAPEDHGAPFSGVSQLSLGDSDSIIAEQVQTSHAMPRTFVRRVSDGAVLGELPSIASEPPFVPRAEIVGTGTPGIDPTERSFDAIIVWPRNFDAVVWPRASDATVRRKYPVIVDVYGGPGHQEVVDSMRPYLLDQWLADRGFIVVAIDGRGTPGRSSSWEHAIAGRFGSVPLEDQVTALRQIGATHPEMDLERVGITGWSFGGYMAAQAVLRRPDVFKAAVAGAPVTDWMDYDTCYTERYLGVPGDGRYPDAYQEGSLLPLAAGLRRPLLLIHGTADDNVYFRHSLRLIDALFRAGKSAEFLPLDSFTHMVPDPVVRTRLEERIAGFFEQHLSAP